MIARNFITINLAFSKLEKEVFNFRGKKKKKKKQEEIEVI